MYEQDLANAKLIIASIHNDLWHLSLVESLDWLERWPSFTDTPLMVISSFSFIMVSWEEFIHLPSQRWKQVYRVRDMKLLYER